MRLSEHIQMRIDTMSRTIANHESRGETQLANAVFHDLDSFIKRVKNAIEDPAPIPEPIISWPTSKRGG